MGAVKITILVEDFCEGKFLEIPLTSKECSLLHDIALSLDLDMRHLMNAYPKHSERLVKKLVHLRHDVLDKGRVYAIDIDADTMMVKRKKNASPHYLVKKPKWSSMEASRKIHREDSNEEVN